MKIIPQELIAIACLALATAGCERNSHGTSAAPEPPAANLSEISAPVAKPASAEDLPQQVSFPITPDLPSLRESNPALAEQDDASLSRTFLNASGADWNQALMEMERRQTPGLLSVLARNLDEIKGAVRMSGEAKYAPELRYPVVQVLMECGEKPLSDLVDVCKSPSLPLKKRVLAARLLKRLEARGHEAASVGQIRSSLSSSAELAAFNETCAVAADDSQVEKLLVSW